MNLGLLIDLEKEFISHNPQITTKFLSRSNLVWIISPWTWRKLSKKTLSNSKVICTIHHLEDKDMDIYNLEDFLERDKYVDKYHVISKKTIDNFKSKLQIKKLFMNRFG